MFNRLRQFEMFVIEARAYANINPLGLRGTMMHFGVSAMEKTLSTLRAL